jgi:hypothetical protein
MVETAHDHGDCRDDSAIGPRSLNSQSKLLVRPATGTLD